MSNEIVDAKVPAKEREMLDGLVNFYLETTAKVLQKDKYLIPIAVRLAKDGKMSFASLAPEDGGEVDMTMHLRAYRELLRKIGKADMACLLGYDIKLNANPVYSDAIAMEVETRDKYRLYLCLPYKFAGLRKRLQFGELQRFEPHSDPIY